MRVRMLRSLISIILAATAAACGDDSNADDTGAALGDGGHHTEVQCPADIPPFTIGLEATGENGAVTARLLDATPAPPQRHRNDWTLEFVDGDGAPIEDLAIDMARPFMPVHGHDGNYPPDVTALDEPGRFSVERLNLWMRGPWLVQLWVSSESAGDDYIEFEVCVR